MIFGIIVHFVPILREYALAYSLVLLKLPFMVILYWFKGQKFIFNSIFFFFISIYPLRVFCQDLHRSSCTLLHQS